MKKERLAKDEKYVEIADGCYNNLVGTIIVPAGAIIIEERDFLLNPYSRSSEKQWFRLYRFMIGNKLTNWMAAEESTSFLERRFNLPD